MVPRNRFTSEIDYYWKKNFFLRRTHARIQLRRSLSLSSPTRLQLSTVLMLHFKAASSTVPSRKRRQRNEKLRSVVSKVLSFYEGNFVWANRRCTDHVRFRRYTRCWKNCQYERKGIPVEKL